MELQINIIIYSEPEIVYFERFVIVSDHELPDVLNKRFIFLGVFIAEIVFLHLELIDAQVAQINSDEIAAENIH